MGAQGSTEALTRCPACGADTGKMPSELMKHGQPRVMCKLLEKARSQGNRTVSPEELAAKLWPVTDQSPLSAPRQIHVVAYKLRADLAPMGWTIINEYKSGYRLVKIS